MENQDKKRRRKIVKRSKGPELVRSVKASIKANMATATVAGAAFFQLHDLWK